MPLYVRNKAGRSGRGGLSPALARPVSDIRGCRLFTKNIAIRKGPRAGRIDGDACPVTVSKTGPSGRGLINDS